MGTPEELRSHILQILLGAVVTVIGASMEHGAAVTVLAAANAVNVVFWY